MDGEIIVNNGCYIQKYNLRTEERKFICRKLTSIEKIEIAKRQNFSIFLYSSSGLLSPYHFITLKTFLPFI